MPASREIAPLALAQLAAWRWYGSKWYWRLELRRTDKGHRIPEVDQYHVICAVCENSIAVVMSEGIGYLLHAERILDEITRHLRNVHRDLEGEIYGKFYAAQAGIDPRGGGAGNGSGPNPGGLQTKK